MRRSLFACLACSLMAATAARADVTILVEEPYGSYGWMNPTGHVAVYLSRVCAETPLSLRLCRSGERGVVISRYHRIGGYDWIAIPLIPYLYAVERPDQVPASATPDTVAKLRDQYRRVRLENIAPDAGDGSAPAGDWIQLVGAAYDRTIHTFGIETTMEADEQLIEALNGGPNSSHFKLLFHNCANFAEQVVNFYVPHAIHRNFAGDLGIMTPKQVGRCLVNYSRRHSDLRFSSFVIEQVPGTVPRSRAIRGVVEMVVKSKRYAVPLAPLAVLHPAVAGGIACAWLGSRIHGRHAEPDGARPLPPDLVARELSSADRSAGD